MRSSRYLLGALCLVTAAAAATWEYKELPLEGTYVTYGGSLADPLLPSRDDHKIRFSITGPAAKEMFDGIAPDVKEICSPQPGERVRKKAGEKLYCQRSAQGRYQCYFGFDLKSGASIGGIVC